MDIKAMGEMVSEALAVQGKVDSLVKKSDALKVQIDANNKELSRLSGVASSRDTAEAKLKEAEVELLDLQAELEKRLAILNEQGVILPLGEKTFNRTGRL